MLSRWISGKRISTRLSSIPRLTNPFPIRPRWCNSAALPGQFKAASAFEDLPGRFKTNKREQIRLAVDPVGFFNDKYEEAKKHDPQRPMIKLNTAGVESVGLFSHDLVRQFQGYELRGQTQRVFPSHLTKLFGKSAGDMQGQTHLNWRAKANKGFKPDYIDQYAPFVQKSVESILLDGIHRENQRTGDYVLGTPRARLVDNTFTVFPLVRVAADVLFC